eukprot:g27625.t1
MDRCICSWQIDKDEVNYVLFSWWFPHHLPQNQSSSYVLYDQLDPSVPQNVLCQSIFQVKTTASNGIPTVMYGRHWAALVTILQCVIGMPTSPYTVTAGTKDT